MNDEYNVEYYEDVFDEDDEQYVLTPWGCLSCVLEDYHIDFSHIAPKVGQHIVEDFMELMEKAGYLVKDES